MTLLPDDPADQRLKSLLRPSDWVNPTPKKRYHLVVIGGGPAGLVCAAGAAGLGAKVALVEKSLLGGDCLLSGCVPSKSLLRAARVADEIRSAGHFGITTSEPQIDFGAVMARLRDIRANLAPNDSAERFRGLGVDVFLGEGKFTSANEFEIEGSKLSFRRAVIATGSRPALPSIPGLNPAEVLTNESVLSLTELPKRLAILGAGPIGCELAQAFARLGSEVTLFAGKYPVLGKEITEASRRVRASLGQDKVKIQSGTEVSRIRREDGFFLLHETESGPFDALLVATGRQPNIENLGLERVGVGYDAGNGIIVDDFLRTTCRSIYAAGDVCTSQKFTHAADAMARLVLGNALFSGWGRFSSLIIPRCTYTDPEVASVGPPEDPTRTQGIFQIEYSTLDRANTDSATDGFVRIVTKPGTDQIQSATIVGPHAGEMIAKITLAMNNKIGLKKLSSVIHPYPTFGEALRKCADAWQKTRLTPFVRWLMRQWLGIVE